MPKMPTGTLMKKIQRQDRNVTMKPPTGAPSTEPSTAGAVRNDMARINSDFGTVFSMTSRPTGTIIAPPMPCSRRAPTRKPSEWAAPHSIELAVNTAMAAANTERAPKRSATQPLTGMNTARLSR